MANPAPISPAKTSKRPQLIKLAAFVLVGLIILIGLVVLIVWLVIHPKRFIYSVEDAYVSNYNLSKDHLNATFNLHVRAHNPNKRVSVYYDSVEVKVEYDDQIVATDIMEPFPQPRHNVTDLYLKPESKDVALLSHTSAKLRLERTSGWVQIDLKIKARVRFKVGTWKSKDRTMKIDCSPVVVHWAPGRSFDRKYCDVHL